MAGVGLVMGCESVHCLWGFRDSSLADGNDDSAPIACPCACTRPRRIHKRCLFAEGEEHWRHCRDALCQCSENVSFPCAGCRQLIVLRKKVPATRDVERALLEQCMGTPEAAFFWTMAQAIAMLTAMTFFAVTMLVRSLVVPFGVVALVCAGGALALTTCVIEKLSHVGEHFTLLWMFNVMTPALGVFTWMLTTLMWAVAGEIHVSRPNVLGSGAFVLYLGAQSWLCFRAVIAQKRRRMTKLEVVPSAIRASVVDDVVVVHDE